MSRKGTPAVARPEIVLTTDRSPFEAAFRKSSDVMMIAGLDDQILLDVNEAFLRLTGYERDEVVGRSLFELDVWANLADQFALMEALEHGLPLVGFSTRLRTPSGRLREMVLSVDAVEVAGRRLAMSIGRDVTEQRVAGRHLWESEERYRALVETCPDAVVVTDAGNKLLMANARALELFRIEELVGRAVSDFVAPEEREHAARMLREVFQKGAVAGVELSFVRSDGSRFAGELSASVTNDTDGAAKAMVAMIRDVTERRRAQDEMSEAFRHERDAVKRLVALDQMRNTFLQAVSHELRTPLASIVGMAVTLERDELRPNEAQTREFARLIATNAKKLESMVTDLLDVERLERGILEPRRSRTDIGDLMHRIVTAFEPLSGREVHVDALSLAVEVDVPKVERIVENLLSNAARHTPQESHVWVGVRKHDEGVLIYVDDDGPGIAPAVRERIFDPFEQGNVVHVEAPGLGIGLSLVARFAELHGGRAWVEPRPGGGAAFRVYLPAFLADVSI